MNDVGTAVSKTTEIRCKDDSVQASRAYKDYTSNSILTYTFSWYP